MLQADTAPREADARIDRQAVNMWACSAELTTYSPPGLPRRLPERTLSGSMIQGQRLEILSSLMDLTTGLVYGLGHRATVAG